MSPRFALAVFWKVSKEHHSDRCYVGFTMQKGTIQQCDDADCQNAVAAKEALERFLDDPR